MAPSRSRLSSLCAEQVREATAAIRRALAGIEKGLPASLADALDAFDEVRQISELRNLSSSEDLAFSSRDPLQQALIEYRTALIEWDRQLPRFHGWLLAERARLGSQCVHAESVQTWINTDRQTR